MSRIEAPRATGNSAASYRSVLLTGMVVGIAVVGAVDEAMFHQLLQWHTLYWSDNESQRILSDGVFHLLTLALLVWGACACGRRRSCCTDAGMLSAPLS